MVFKTENGNWILNFHIGASEADALLLSIRAQITSDIDYLLLAKQSGGTKEI